jgi:hypothetical protein
MSSSTSDAWVFFVEGFFESRHIKADLSGITIKVAALELALVGKQLGRGIAKTFLGASLRSRACEARCAFL